MASFKHKYGPWAVITGGSSGFGAEYARQVAARGLNVVLVARRADKMEALAAELREAHGVEVKVAAVDLSAQDLLEQLEPAVAGLEVGLLVNNAGFTMTGTVTDLDLAGQVRMVDVACRAPLILTHRFAPAMKERKRGGILFTSSVVAFGGAPLWCTYNATKSFDLIFAEGLAAELGPHGVDVQAVCPGGTYTGFAEVGNIQTGGIRRVFMMHAPPVVRASLRWLGTFRVVVPGILNKIMALQIKLIPRRVATWVLGRVVRLLAH